MPTPPKKLMQYLHSMLEERLFRFLLEGVTKPKDSTLVLTNMVWLPWPVEFYKVVPLAVNKDFALIS